MSNWLQEIRVAARSLRSRPGFTLVAVLTLALGIGATTALFSVVDGVLLAPLPYPDAGRLVRLFSTSGGDIDDRASASLPDFRDWQRQSKTLSALAGFVRWNYNLAGEGRPQRAWGGMATANLAAALGVEPVVGRFFSPAEDQPGGPRVVVLSEPLWRELFAADPAIAGRRLRLDEVEYEIVGVMPAGFDVPSDVRLWTPLGMSETTSPRAVHFLRAVGRLAPGVSAARAQAEMSAIARRLERLYPDTNTGREVRVVPLRDHLVGGLRPALWTLLAAAALVLLIACANLANLMAARFSERRAELALRRALGASRVQLYRQLLAETLLLALGGGAAGLALGAAGSRLLVDLGLAWQSASPFADRLHLIPNLDRVGLDGRMIAFALLATTASALVVSLLPATQMAEGHLGRALDAGAKGAVRAGAGRRLRRLFVVVEVAVALGLLISAILLLRSFAQLTHRDPGFRGGAVMSFQVLLPVRKYAQSSQTTAFYRELLARVEALPGVASAGLTWGLPLSGNFGSSEIEIEGRPARPHELSEVSPQPVSARYFETLGIPVLRGRPFGERDDEQAPPVVIVNQALARRFFPGEDPVGKRLSFTGAFGPVGSVPRAPREIVGLVADTRSAGLGKEPPAELYFPYPQSTWRMASVVVRASGDPRPLAPALAREVWALDKDLAVSNLATLDEVTAQSVAQPRLSTTLLALLAGLALALAAIGIYGIISYSVNARVSEIGVRMALGARRGDVMREVLREGAGLTVAGLALGILAAWGLTRLLSELLYGVSPTDPWTFAGAPLVLLGIALLACWLPARRATRVDPLVALRG